MLIICIQTQKQLATLNNFWTLFKSVLTDLRARNFVGAKTSLRARCVEPWKSSVKQRVACFSLVMLMHLYKWSFLELFSSPKISRITDYFKIIFCVFFFLRMQNDMKLPKELRRK